MAFKSASALPQGYLKRLELAKAIALKPDLIILDELFSGLSLAEVASIIPIIEKLRKEGKTIIMIEHRLKELFRIADRVVVLDYGQKIADGRLPRPCRPLECRRHTWEQSINTQEVFI